MKLGPGIGRGLSQVLRQWVLGGPVDVCVSCGSCSCRKCPGPDKAPDFTSRPCFASFRAGPPGAACVQSINFSEATVSGLWHPTSHMGFSLPLEWVVGEGP